MHLATLIAFIGLEFVLCLIPGPAVMSVVSAALSRDRSGFPTALGILTGNAFYFIVTGAGIAAVLVASHVAFEVVKWIGAAYLCYLGIRSIVTAGARIDAAPHAGSRPGAMARGWLTGTVTQLGNPKAFVFYGAILPQFIDPRAAVVPQVLALAVAGILVELVVLSGYILIADKLRGDGMPTRARAWIERAGGALLIAVAAAIAREAA